MIGRQSAAGRPNHVIADLEWRERGQQSESGSRLLLLRQIRDAGRDPRGTQPLVFTGPLLDHADHPLAYLEGKMIRAVEHGG